MINILQRSEVEQINRQEFEQFTRQWDQKLRDLSEQGQIQVEQLRQKHAREMEELRIYLESSMSLNFKPSPELLNFRKV